MYVPVDVNPDFDCELQEQLQSGHTDTAVCSCTGNILSDRVTLSQILCGPASHYDGGRSRDDQAGHGEGIQHIHGERSEPQPLSLQPFYVP